MDSLSSLLTTAGDRFSTNIKGSITAMSPDKWIRIVIVAGGYMLLRPYLIKLGARSQMRAHEKAEAESEAERAAAEISPNQLRGQAGIIPSDSDDDDDDEEGTPTQSSGADWGKKARKRQRVLLRKMIEAQEKKLQESRDEEEDKDIEEFFVKD